MKEYFEGYNLTAASLARIEEANEIIDEYEGMGYKLTLRQLYYQFVSADLIENTERSYKNLGVLVNKARMSGLMDWDAIEDRTRNVQRWKINESMRSIFYAIEYDYALDFWKEQDVYVEVWVEKEALAEIVEQAVRKYKAPYLSCRGYISQSEAYRAGKRFHEHAAEGRECHLIHLGDHDPSGIDMTRDNRDRIWTMSGTDVWVDRIALNMDQIEEYRPPRNPAKLSDSRAGDYVQKYGRSSWELDALRPEVLEELIQSTLSNLINHQKWEETKRRQEEKRAQLERIYTNWDKFKPLIESL